MISFTATLLIVALLCLLTPQVAAFGAGDIPDYAYLNDKAFRHGDIENILTTLLKNHATESGNVIKEILGSIYTFGRGRGDKFTEMDLKRVYFGNWLRDYSQAMDITALSHTTAETIVTLVSVLGFLAFGFATEEFEVTPNRLGVYLPVEPLYSPKGYAKDHNNNARQFHSELRPPVEEVELEIDQNTGMKKYIATEGQSWDTSTAYVRRTLEACIQRGRLANGKEGADMWEAFRLLGTALHTIEDLLAHSNWVELGLLKMGHSQVFCHVGDNVKVNTPRGPAPPLTTGTFGAADFVHSLLGEATDHLSSTSVADLSHKISEAKTGTGYLVTQLRSLFDQISSLGGGDNQGAMNEGLKIQGKISKIALHSVPVIGDIVDKLFEALNMFVWFALGPILNVIIQEATVALQEGSASIVNSEDQYEVFNNPYASDPSHSLLSKDHFDLVLNEPAGKIARVTVKHTVELVVQAWSDRNQDVGQTINHVMEVFHHPYYATDNSQVQKDMADELGRWFNGLGVNSSRVIQSLTKQSVREGRNKRVGDSEAPNGLATAVKTISDKATEVLKPVGEIANQAVDTIKDTANKTVDVVKGAVNGTVNTVNGAFKAGFGWF
ncbi:heterokaryon incompatibility protein Het-C protein [Ceratobasidium sp. AG-Ba]|nr:heterokaryon incompatibility protein Het-C protein [Ceratobasidium sp. AG-Ba]